MQRTHPADGVVTLTFNRPEKMNALSTALLDEFEEHFSDIERDRSVRAVILTGAGERAFVAGADIGEYAEGDSEAFIAFQLRGRRVNDRIEALPKVTIAAVHGYALGGGFEIALCCDIILATPEARFGLPEGQLGLSPGGGGTQRLVRAVGRHVASDVLLTGRRLTGTQALTLGLVADVVPHSELAEAALSKADYAKRIAPNSVREMKRLLREGADAPLVTALSLEQEVLFRLFESPDGREGVRAFMEKRTPDFSG